MENKKMDITNLPEEYICRILSYTSPKDACRSSLVHSGFRAAADSDSLWEQFLPLDNKEIISQSSSPSLNSLSKKRLSFQLCDHPVLAADNNMVASISGGEMYLNIGSRHPCKSPDSLGNRPATRNDGWKKVLIGEFFSKYGDDCPVAARLFAFDGSAPVAGLIIEGIEFRPKIAG